jgi:hypothetical protein
MGEVVETVFLLESLALQHVVFEFSLDAAEGDEWRLITGYLEQATEQGRYDLQFGTGALENAWQHFVCEVGIGAGEIENKFKLWHG